MVDFLLGGAAVVLLVIATVVLLRSERLGRARLTGLVALIVLAAGTFAGAIYHHASSSPAAEVVVPLPIASSAGPAPGAAISKIELSLGTGDKLPQGALWLDPPRPGTDAYTGDLSLLCSTPGKTDNEQNCTGTDPRVWTVEPLAGRAVLAAASGDPFADPGACDVSFAPGYLELAAGRSYCARLTADPKRTHAFRVPAFPADQPLPTSLNAEVVALG
ncbi:hypothetical protein GCM10010172_27920 [Paractinoplanes ferrugineus]|uniref:Uncharacterized protein n=1 Tax=Paractinoplanes ferrugineus TaxID=113564 RepID=A0A919MA41_9ACTN|nr:hypothetical protein [Actinoplanes ferrugineus]GIE08298.1 hypothetical protein Afe05nite_01380 [Actinoplanes ferrugineus]